MTQRRPIKWGSTSEALEEQHAERVQVGALINIMVEETGLLGRDVVHVLDDLGWDRRAEAAAAGNTEVDQDGAREGTLGTYDHVAWLHTAMKDARVMGLGETLGEAAADQDDFGDGKRPVCQPSLEGDSRDDGRREVEEMRVDADIEGRSQPGAVKPLECAGLLLQSGQGCRRERCRRSGLEDDRRPGCDIGGQEGGHRMAVAKDLLWEITTSHGWLSHGDDRLHPGVTRP